MEKYKNLDGDSGVASYEVGDTFVRVMFSDGAVYLYTNGSAGEQNINQMKMLAVNGDGLNAFINKNVRKKYAKKER
jgi:hypothetical protein